MKIKKVSFPPHGDSRGQLVALEEMKEIPFEVKRIYYMYDTACDAVRGKHAHRALEQILICVHGNCKVRLDDGNTKEIVVLDKPYEGLYIKNDIWREMFDFSDDAVLMVIASELYDESDYIRDYDTFLEEVRLKGQFNE